MVTQPNFKNIQRAIAHPRGHRQLHYSILPSNIQKQPLHHKFQPLAPIILNRLEDGNSRKLRGWERALGWGMSMLHNRLINTKHVAVKDGTVEPEAYVSWKQIAVAPTERSKSEKDRANVYPPPQ